MWGLELRRGVGATERFGGASHPGDTTGEKKWAAYGTQNTNILGARGALKGTWRR